MRTDDSKALQIQVPPPLRHHPESVINALSPFVTPQRLRRIEQVVAQRTDDLVVVLDQIADPHNASAILRSADAFGVQTLHAIVGDQGLSIAKGVSKGTQRWVDVSQHASTQACVESLRTAGFPIFVASMEASCSPETLGTMDRLAIVFGNEHKGVSQDIMACANGTFAIPMQGFVESLNVSVAAAITMRALRKKMGAPLSPMRQLELKAKFLMHSVKNAEQLIQKTSDYGQL